MKNTVILEMINNGEIEELKNLLKDEIYNDSLKGNGTAKKRYVAMKRYFKYPTQNNPALQKPCKDVMVHGETYNSFVDGYTLVLTTESIGELESYDNSKNTYFDVGKMVDFSLVTNVEEMDLNTILAEAKSKGYKYKKSEIGTGNEFQYVFKYKDGYYKVGLLDQAFSIINDGEKAEVYYINSKSLLLIKTSVGIAGILPFNPLVNVEKEKTVIVVDELLKAA